MCFIEKVDEFGKMNFIVRFKNNLLAKLKEKYFMKEQITTKEFNEAEKLLIISEQKYLSNEYFKQL